jgi:hypothetical protein
MASRVSNLLNVIGRNIKDPGSVMYHAADGVGPDGAMGKEKRHSMRKALVKLRLRASGMTDDLLGSKETGGTMENKFEQAPGK